MEKDLERRDYIDSHREFAPLKQASDAVLVDTTHMSIDEAIDAMTNIVLNKVGNINGK